MGALSHRFFFGWEGFPTEIDYTKKGTLILSALLEDLVDLHCQHCIFLESEMVTWQVAPS